jgi:hypothetical protein
MQKDNYCPVCGYSLDLPAWDEDSPSDEICPSCGIQFGYDDARGGEFREGQYFGWRKKWIQDGCIWYSSQLKPKNWNPTLQLKNIGVSL